MATKKSNAGDSDTTKWFVPTDILDLKGLAAKIKEPKDPFSEFLLGRIQPETRKILQEWNGAKASSTRLRNALIHDFIQLVNDSAVYEPARFAQVELSQEARSLAESKPQGRDLVRLNKMLIEESYPDELLRKFSRWPVVPVERIQFNVRVEKRMLKVLKALAEAEDMTLSEMFEDIVLHAFDGHSTFSEDGSQAKIEALKSVYGMDYDAHAAYRFSDRA
jgi:hypothetical protein